MKRFGMVIALRPEAEQAYRENHAAVWPAVLDTIRRCNIPNYSIFLRNGMLFSYFEHHGAEFEADMAAMAADPATQAWWALVKPMQQPLPDRREGEWWAEMEELFHLD